MSILVKCAGRLALEHILKNYPHTGLALLRVLYRCNLTFCIWTQGMKRKHVRFAKTLLPRGKASGVLL